MSADSDWSSDVLGAPYEQTTIDLGIDDEGPVEATLVRRLAPGGSSRAVLHVHGFCDYFFQTAAADFWIARGYDFYALDLRRYGRSLREWQTPAYVDDLSVHYAELDAAFARIAADHEQVVLSAHSNGGLIGSLWAGDRGPHLAGMFLNAPWLDLAGSVLLRTAGTAVIDQLGARQPKRVVPREVSGFYARSLSREHGGEWDFDLAWRPIGSFPVYAGWLRAVRRGHARIAAGLDLQTPVLVMSSARHTTPPTFEHPDQHRTDTVLDVEQIRRRAPLLGRHVTNVHVEGALHDVTLSRPTVRTVVFDELGRWLEAYVER